MAARVYPLASNLSGLDYLPEMVERIVQGFHPVRIILFGSRARGEARPTSDVDLLVVLPDANGGDKRKAAIAIRRVLNGVPVSKDIVVTTPAEIKKRGQVIGLVLRSALREGKVIYE